MSKKKRTLSPEHLAKLQAGRQRHLAQSENIKVNEDGTIGKIDPTKPASFTTEPIKWESTVLDVTKENVPNETDLLERIRRMFDEGNNPDVIKVTSRQMMDILDNSSRMVSYDVYGSPFGDHEVQIIPAKDIHADN